MAEISTEEMSELYALRQAAVRLFDAAQREHRERDPHEHQSYCDLVKLRGAQLYVDIMLTPALVVEVGFAYNGERRAIHRWAPKRGYGRARTSGSH